MKKWIVKSTLDKREHYKSKVIEADTEDEAYEYYMNNDVDEKLVSVENLEECPTTRSVEEVKEGGA